MPDSRIQNINCSIRETVLKKYDLSGFYIQLHPCHALVVRRSITCVLPSFFVVFPDWSIHVRQR